MNFPSRRSGVESGALYFGDSYRIGQGRSRAGERVFVIQAKDSAGAFNTVAALYDGGLYVDSLPQEAWHLVGATGEPAFLNDWSNVGGSALGFFKDSFGIVHLRGMVEGGTAEPIFTLPVGYRPSEAASFATVANGVFARTTISTAGVVSQWTSNTDVALDGVSFRADGEAESQSFSDLGWNFTRL